MSAFQRFFFRIPNFLNVKMDVAFRKSLIGTSDKSTAIPTITIQVNQSIPAPLFLFMALRVPLKVKQRTAHHDRSQKRILHDSRVRKPVRHVNESQI